VPTGNDGGRVVLTLQREDLEELIFGSQKGRRFTQDSPVLPDVWIEYGMRPGERVDLLLTPHSEGFASELGHAIRERTESRDVARTDRPNEARIAYNESYVVAELDFDELVQVALPLTQWWRRHVCRHETIATQLDDPSIKATIASKIETTGTAPLGHGEISPDLLWLMKIVGRIELERRNAEREKEPTNDELVAAANDLLTGDVADAPDKPLLWRVDRNRTATVAIAKSILAVKADAAVRLFDLNCRELRWAVIDSGIDATHWAFRKRDGDGAFYEEPFEAQPGSAPTRNNTRVIATYDFTRLRKLLHPEADVGAVSGRKITREDRQRARDFQRSLKLGRPIDWPTLEPLLKVPHEPGEAYEAPVHEHGTHVGGILTADWKLGEENFPGDHSILGIAAGLELYDLRVFDDKGRGDEFTLIAALQFIRYMNANKDRILVHGVNLSLSILHDVANFGCGRTPICEECERLVGAGTVVVAAGGNEGYARYQLLGGAPSDGYRSISITDPGNADGVITVGATHRNRPHSYGVSYFSSRGPTGDGRSKPDLVAPGEKITAPVPGNQLKTMDGTSMAAPHVSAAAALLMARHQELIGRPAEIKRVLCDTATDLGRERYFQGHGMLDVLRALQAV
jgi:hypothetical protein